jgi:hypothetical protein
MTRAMLVVVAALSAVLLAVYATTQSLDILPPSASRGAEVVDAWLDELAGADGDLGWAHLAAELKDRAYGGDQAVYRRDVESVQWRQVRWADTQGRTEDGFFFGYTDLLSDPRTLPRFLFERGIVGPNCVDRAAMGIYTNMQSQWLTPPRLMPVGSAGSGDECSLTFYADAGPLRSPADLVGGAWATGGNGGIRAELEDLTGLVREVSPGRDSPPINGEVTVTGLEPDRIGVAWVGTDCPLPVRLVLQQDRQRLNLALISAEPTDSACSARSRTYEVVLRFNQSVSAEDFHAVRGP